MRRPRPTSTHLFQTRCAAVLLGALGLFAVVLAPAAGAIDLKLTKEVSPTEVDVGENVVFTVTVSNSGNGSSASGVEVTDLLPDGYTYVSDVPSTGSYDEISGVWMLGSVADESSETLQITAQVTPQTGDPMGTGAYLDVFASTGLSAPEGLAFDAAGDLYVASSGSDEVVRLDGTTGAVLETFANAALVDPRYLAFGPEGDLYVSSFATDTVVKIDLPAGTLTTFASGGGLDGPTGLVFRDGDLYVASSLSDQILRYDGSSGAFVEIFNYACNLHVDDPQGLALIDRDDVLVANPGTLQVLRYEGASGLSEGSFAGSLDEELADPSGLVQGPDDELYAMDSGGARILRYDGTSGELVGVFTSGGPAADPADLAFGPDGFLFVADRGNNQVLRYDGYLVNTASLTAVTGGDDDATNSFDVAAARYTKIDFGDAPDDVGTPQFPTLLGNQGARHSGGGIIRLGTLWDGEVDGQPTAQADGDTSDDGVSIPVLIPGQTHDITVTGTAGAFLNAWIDFDGDGSWAQPGDQIATDVVLTGAAQNLSINVPAGANGTLYARFRADSGGGLQPTGYAADGEVEDWTAFVDQVGLVAAQGADPIELDEPGGSVTYTVMVSNSASVTSLDLTSLTDSQAGNLNGQGTCSIPQTIVGGGSYVCAYTRSVDGNAGDVITSTLSSSGTSAGEQVSDMASAMVTLLDAAPTLSVTVIPNPIMILEPGGEVEYSVEASNTSAQSDPITLSSLTDNIFGDITTVQGDIQSTDCTAGGLVSPGQSYSCTFVVSVTCTGGMDVENTVTVSGTDDETNLAAANGDGAVSCEADVEPPAVLSVATGSGPLAECDTPLGPVSTLEVTFADNGDSIVGADLTGSYLLVGTGPDFDFSTTRCASGVEGDDVAVTPDVILLAGQGSQVTATLSLPGTEGLENGLYRFLVCDSITDGVGNALDGDGDLSPGGDFLLSAFRADPTNLLLNGHFDDCPVSLDPWISMTTGTVQTDLADSDDSPLSGSVQVLHSGDQVSSVGQCVDLNLDGSGDFLLGSRYQFEIIGSQLQGTLTQGCELFSGSACTGQSQGAPSGVAMISSTGDSWVEFSVELGVYSASSALCDFTLSDTSGQSTLLLDALTLNSRHVIFADGFESGDTMSWFSTVP